MGDGVLRREKARTMPNSTVVFTRQSVSQRKVLHSWKDIANYTGRGVRTLQRYEAKLGFPIHRPAGKIRSAVLAFSDEVDEWLGKAPMAAAMSMVVAPGDPRADQLQERREWLAVAANAKLSRERAGAAYEACAQQSKRVEEMIERIKAARARVQTRSTLFA
jgi:hypothetical protein